MKITHCKLSKKNQVKRLEFFTAQVTARTAANLLQIQPNTVALFYHKIRLGIDYHLAKETDELFDSKVELDESYFGVYAKTNVVVVRRVRPLYFVF